MPQLYIDANYRTKKRSRKKNFSKIESKLLQQLIIYLGRKQKKTQRKIAYIKTTIHAEIEYDTPNGFTGLKRTPYARTLPSTTINKKLNQEAKWERKKICRTERMTSKYPLCCLISSF